MALVKDGRRVTVFLNGELTPEITTDLPESAVPVSHDYFFGGRCDNDSNWEGRLDGIAVFESALSAKTIGSIISGTNGN